MKYISEQLVNRIDDILDHFQLEYTEHNGIKRGICPIHIGNNKSAFVLYPNGIWKCWSNSCDSVYGSSILGLIRGLLSVSKPVSKQQTLDWCYQFLGIKQRRFTPDINRNWIKLNSLFNKEIETEKKRSREEVIKRLKIPAPYYLNRGYSSSILSKYDVGLCVDRTKPMYLRTVFPVYSDGFLVGCVGRSINEKCDKCGLYHYYGCPQPNPYYYKWRNSTGFQKGNWLFNFDFAKEFINRDQSLILVEGTGDVLRLEEAEIRNSLALFGSDITDNQKLLLEKLNCLNVILALDNDKAGEAAKEKITKKLEKTYNISYLTFSGKDVGETSLTELRDSYRCIIR